jgi:hypothetical protein
MFKMGDKVIVSKPFVGAYQIGGHTSEMDHYKNKIFTIKSIYNNGESGDAYRFEGDARFLWDERCLTLSQSNNMSKDELRKQAICTKIIQMEQRRKEQGYAF